MPMPEGGYEPGAESLDDMTSGERARAERYLEPKPAPTPEEAAAFHAPHTGPRPPTPSTLLQQYSGVKALQAAAAAARTMHHPPAPDCVEWADWLDARAERLMRVNPDE